MAQGPFIQKWVFNPRTGQTDLEIDEIRAQFPAVIGSASGYIAFSNTEKTSVLIVPSAHRFLLRFMWAFNDTGAVNILGIYDGPGVSMSAGAIHIGASNTEFINFGDGVIFKSAVHMSNLVSNITVRIGGLLIKSGPE